MLIFKPLPLAMLLTGCLSSAWGAQLTQPLTLKDVTVYLHGASLQGEETLNLPAGESEIIFTNIANSVTDDSIAISIDNGVKSSKSGTGKTDRREKQYRGSN